MKRMIALAMAAVLFAMPLSAAAATNTAVIKKVRNVSNVSTSGAEYMLMYIPKSVSAAMSGKNIVVKAETTTTPVKIQIEYCSNKQFKKNVIRKTFANKKYKSTVYMGAYQTGKRYDTDLFRYPNTSSFSGDGAVEAALKLETSHKSYKAALSYARAQSTAKTVRKYVKANNTFKLTGVGKKGGFVRIRAVYKVNNVFAKSKTCYTPWKITKIK